MLKKDQNPYWQYTKLMDKKMNYQTYKYLCFPPCIFMTDRNFKNLSAKILIQGTY